jgi:TATA-box binding protein (TBP) (component of TFIID and TFIIIB)
MEYLTFLGNVVKARDKLDRKPSLLRVSTMTVMGGRKDVTTSLTTFAEKFTSGTKGWKMANNHFNNSVTIFKELSESKKRSVKLFANGKIHVTGSSTPMEGDAIIQEIQELVDEIFPDVRDRSPIPMEIQMINATFQVPHGINQLALLDLYKTYRNKVSKISFNPETYSAVKATIFGTTVSVFKTGSVVLAGAKTFKDLAVIYKFLLDVLYHPDVKLGDIAIKNQGKTSPYQSEPFIQAVREYYLLNK